MILKKEKPGFRLLLSRVIISFLFIQSNIGDGKDIKAGLPAFPGAEGFDSNSKDLSREGYTNIEVYINGMINSSN